METQQTHRQLAQDRVVILAEPNGLGQCLLCHVRILSASGILHVINGRVHGCTDGNT